MLNQISDAIKNEFKKYLTVSNPEEYVSKIQFIVNRVKTVLTMNSNYRLHKGYNPQEIIAINVHGNYRLMINPDMESFSFKDHSPTQLKIKIIFPNDPHSIRENFITSSVTIDDVFDIEKFIEGSRLIKEKEENKEQDENSCLYFSEGGREELGKRCSFQLNAIIGSKEIRACYNERNELYAFNHTQAPKKYADE